MAEQLLLLAENLLSEVQFPQHVLAGSSAAAGFPAEKVANERRNAPERWEPTGTNADAYLTVACNILRAADCLILDRGCNALGYRYQLLASDDNFVLSTVTLWDTNPLPSVPGGVPSSMGGCVTDEGAWVKTFPADAYNYWRVMSKAMGAGLKPQLTGVWLGKAWQPTLYVLRHPMQDQRVRVDFPTQVSPYGWMGRGLRARARTGTLRIALPTADDEAMAEYHLMTRFLNGRPMWLCWQRGTAPWRAMLVVCPPGTELDWSRDPGWHPMFRSADVPFIEEQPVGGGV